MEIRNNFESEDIEIEDNSNINEINQEDEEDQNIDIEDELPNHNIIKFKNEDYQANNIIDIFFELSIKKKYYM